MGAERWDGWNGSFEIIWTNPRHESLLQDRSGPWEGSTKTGVVHGRSAPRQEWSMGGEHQEVVQKADGHIVHFTAFAAGFTITCWTVGSVTGSKEETDCSKKKTHTTH